MSVCYWVDKYGGAIDCLRGTSEGGIQLSQHNALVTAGSSTGASYQLATGALVVLWIVLRRRRRGGRQ